MMAIARSDERKLAQLRGAFEREETEETSVSLAQEIARIQPKDWRYELRDLAILNKATPESMLGKVVEDHVPGFFIDLTYERLDPTRKALWDMLKENTGVAMMDSGGDNGRAWQRNGPRNFETEKECTATFGSYKRGAFIDGKYMANAGGMQLEVEFTHNVYHWLAERLDYDEELTKHILAWGQAPEQDGEPWLGLSEPWVKAHFPEAGGIYGDGDPMTVNTYNGEDLLSQTLQYVYFTTDACEIPGVPEYSDGEATDEWDVAPIEVFGQAYVVLHIHGGADVRGGYTSPMVFGLGDSHEETAIFDNARAMLYVQGPVPPEVLARWTPQAHDEAQAFLPTIEREEAGPPEHLIDPKDTNWSTDDGCHWYHEGACGASYTQLEDMPITTDPRKRGDGIHIYVGETSEIRRELDDLPEIPEEDENKAFWIDGREILPSPY